MRGRIAPKSVRGQKLEGERVQWTSARVPVPKRPIAMNTAVRIIELSISKLLNLKHLRRFEFKSNI